jgi:hypothetical protein
MTPDEWMRRDRARPAGAAAWREAEHPDPTSIPLDLPPLDDDSAWMRIQPNTGPRGDALALYPQETSHVD